MEFSGKLYALFNKFSQSFKYRRASLRAVALSALFGPIVFITCYAAVGSTIYLGTVLAINVPLLYLFVDLPLNFTGIIKIHQFFMTVAEDASESKTHGGELVVQ